MSRGITRRALIGAIGVGALLPALAHAQYELTPEVVPAPPASTPAATPEAPSEEFRGDLRALWDEPWEVEDKLIRFKCIVIQRLTAAEGKAIRVGVAGSYRTLLRVDIPSSGTMWVASDLSLDPIQRRKTIEVEGVYGGEFGPGWTEPVVIAAKWGPAS